MDLNQYPGEDYWKNVVDGAMKRNKKELSDYYKKIRIEVIKSHLGNQEIIEVEHTACHAAAGLLFNQQEFRRAAVVTLDGWGDGVNHSIRVLDNKEGENEIELIMKKGTSEIARIYRYATLALGMKPNEHEYKIMGLAPYANKKYTKNVCNKLKEIVKVDDISINKCGANKDTYFHLKNIFEGERFDNIAGGLQEFVEDLLVEWFSNIARLGVDHIIYCGGVAMNVKANMTIKEIT